MFRFLNRRERERENDFWDHGYDVCSDYAPFEITFVVNVHDSRAIILIYPIKPSTVSALSG